MTENEQKVLAAMKEAGKPVRPGDIATKTGIDSKEVSKIIKALKQKEEVYSPKRCYYAPAEEK
ncbi:MAG: transcriptional regulator [Euryarchaeota archaeon]|nr:transcriptional regulator [Euryarchaeota archaeon]